MDATEELRALRARAYGPEPDIFDDDAALERLRRLEADAAGARSASAQTPPAVDPVVVSDSSPGGTAESTGDPVAGEPDEPEQGEASVAPPPSRRRLVLAWGGSILVTIVVVAAVTAFVSRASSREGQVDAVLARVPHAVVPSFPGLIRDDLARFADFYGLGFVAGPVGQGEARQDDCLYVYDLAGVPNAESTTWSGFITTACAVGAFPAVVQTRTMAGFPAELLARYPAGTPLQFVLENDQVTVLRGQDVGGTAALFESTTVR